jgi:hypothetical protein
MVTPKFHLHQRRAEGSDPFLWAEGVPDVEMHRMMSVQYGNGVMSQRIVCYWSERFKNGRTSVKHGDETGRQSTSITDADTAHTVQNLKKLNFEVLEHSLYSLDLTPSDSPVWPTALVCLNMKHTVRVIIDSPSDINVCTIPDTNYSSHASYLLVRRLIMFYHLITVITNIPKYPTDDWLTTFPFLTSHIWPNNHQSETFTMVLNIFFKIS